MIWTLAQVALGGALGAMGRYLTSVAAVRLMGHGFPWGTLAVNIAGSFLMGVLVVVLGKKGGMHLAPLMVTGMLGGFTTFSTFSLDVLTIYERGQVGLAAGYAAASVILSLGAIALALAVTRGAFA
jgi:CrcB protein